MSSTKPHDEALALVLDRLLEQVRTGEDPEMEEVCRAHPDLAPQIREILPTIVAMERLKPRPGTSAAPQTARTGTEIGDYRIVREIGRGGMGIVYEAIQGSLGRPVALKVISHHLLSDSAAIIRFRREARAVARLHHTNIVPVFEIGQQGEQCYYAMQFIEGLGLDQVIRQVRDLVPNSARGLRSPGASPAMDRLSSVARSLFQRRSGCETAPAEMTVRSRSDDEAAAESPKLGNSPDREAGTSSDNRRAEAPISGEARCADGNHVGGSSSGSSWRQYYRSVARIGLQTADALHYAHGKQVVHRDVKPSNLLVDGSGTVWITDFGLAQVSDTETTDSSHVQVTHTGDVVGTMRYMSPERLRGQHDSRGDIYGLGMTLYELLALSPAFATTDRVKLLEEIVSTQPAPLHRLDPGIPRDLATIVNKAIAKDPSDRYQTADALAADLRRFLDDKPIHARTAGWGERLWRWSRRNPGVAGLSTAVAVLAGLLAVGMPVMHVVRTERDRALTAERQAIASQKRAERAEREVQIRSHLAQATAFRRSGRIGQRFQCLEELTAAARLRPSTELRRELRDEAIAALGLTDLKCRIDHAVDRLKWPQCDDQFSRYAFVDLYGSGETIIRSLDDNCELLRIPRPEISFWHATPNFTPDGKHVWVVYFPRGGSQWKAILHVWRIEPLERVLEQEIRSMDVVGAVAARDDHILFVDPHLDLCVWDLAARKEVRRRSLGMIPYCISLDSAGQRIAVNNVDIPLVRILDLATGDEIAAWSSDVGTYDMAWSADGQLLATGLDLGRILVRHMPDGEIVSVLEGEVVRLEFAHRGNLLASSGWNGTTQLWDAVTGEKLVQAQGEMVRFSEDDQQLAYVHSKGMGVWDVAHAQETRAIHAIPQRTVDAENAYMGGACFGPDHSLHQMLVTYGMGGIWFWDRVTGNELANVACGRTDAVLCRRDGCGLVTITGANECSYWPIRHSPGDDSESYRIGPPSVLRSLGSSTFQTAGLLPDDRTVAVADNAKQRVLLLPLPGLNPSADRPRERELPSRHSRITNLSVSPDGRWLAAGGWKEQGIQVWDLDSGQFVRMLPHSDSATATAFWAYFTPDNRWLISGAYSDDSCSYLSYRVGSWERGFKLPLEFGTGIRAAFSADGRFMALSRSSNQVVIVDSQGRELSRLTSGNRSDQPAALSDDGSELIVMSGLQPMRWWNLRRIEEQLERLGLGWQSIGDGPHASGHFLPPVADQENRPAAWSRSRSGGRSIKVEVDAGHLLQQVAARAKARDLAEKLSSTRLLVRTGHGDSARSALEQALRTEAENGEVQIELAWLLITGPEEHRDIPRALTLANAAAATEPKKARLRTTLALAHYRAGAWNDAINVLSENESANGADVPLQALVRAMAYVKLDQPETARDWYEKAHRWLEDHPATIHDEATRLLLDETANLLGMKPPSVE